MASDLEDDEDLASLRNAALASLNVRSAQASPLTVTNVQEDSKQDEDDDDDDLEALRLAALKTKKATVPQPVTPQPRGPTQVPFAETSNNTVRGNNLISIPLVDLSTQNTSSKEPVVPEVKKEVRNDKFSRFQSDSESEEEESDQEEQEDDIKNVENDEEISSAEEDIESDKSDDESVEESSKEDDSESSESSDSDTENSSGTENSSISSESEESSSEENETIQEPSITKEPSADKQNGLQKVKSDTVKEFKLSVTDKTVDLRNQLRKKHLERRNNHIERENRYKTHRVTNEATSRSYSRSYDDRKRTSQNEPDKYDSNRDRKSDNVGRIREQRQHYERPRKTDIKSRVDDNCKDNKKERDRKDSVSSSERNRVLDRRKADKTKENRQSGTLKNDEKEKNISDSFSDSEESDDDTDSRFKQLKNDRSVDQNISARSRIVSSMQLNQKFEPNFGRSREIHRDRRKDLEVRYASRFDNRDQNRWNDSHRKDQYYRDDKIRDKHNDPWKRHTGSSHEQSRGKNAAKSRELEFVDYSDDEQHKKSIRSFVHTKETKKCTKQRESKDKKDEHKKEFENEKHKPSSKERTDYDRSKENRARKSKSESSIKLLKRVKRLDVDDENKTTEVSVTFDSDPDKVLKKSKKSIQERLGKTVSKHKPSVKLRLGSKDGTSSNTWDSVKSISMESGDQNLRKFVSKDSVKSRKSVKERLNLKRTPDEIGIDSSVEPSRKIVRTSKSTGALDKMNEEEKLKRKQKEKEIQEKIRKIEERNLAASKETVKDTKDDIPDYSKNKDKELELRIQRIQEKNEAILKRQREIEEDKQKYGK